MTTQPCPRCGKNRWKTKKKGLAWRCRNCGLLREARLEPVVKVLESHKEGEVTVIDKAELKEISIV